MRVVILALVFGFAATPALASREISVQADQGWTHAATGLTLPASLDGLPRAKITDNTATEYDVAAQYDDGHGTIATIATIFVYRPVIDNVAMWFERSAAAIETRDVFGSAAPTSPEPVVFSPPGGQFGNALRRTYAPTNGPFHATGLAMMPVGPWLVTLRVSAKALKPSELDRRIDAMIAAIGWPAAPAPGPALIPISACSDTLHFEKAKVVKGAGSDILFSLLMSAVGHDPKVREDAKPITFCRDAASTPAYGIYRDQDGSKGYTMALSDAGRVAHVRPTLDTMSGKASSYAVSLSDVDEKTYAFSSFDRLPSPDQVMALIAKEPNSSASTKDGKTNININPADLK